MYFIMNKRRLFWRKFWWNLLCRRVNHHLPKNIIFTSTTVSFPQWNPVIITKYIHIRKRRYTEPPWIESFPEIHLKMNNFVFTLWIGNLSPLPSSLAYLLHLNSCLTLSLWIYQDNETNEKYYLWMLFWFNTGAKAADGGSRKIYILQESAILWGWVNHFKQ